MTGIIFLVAAWGCANGSTVVVWERIDGEEAAEGEFEAARNACDPGVPTEPEEGVRRDRYQADRMGRAFVDCMRERGWTWRTEKRSRD